MRRGPNNFIRFLVWETETGDLRVSTVRPDYKQFPDMDISWDGQLWYIAQFGGGLGPIGQSPVVPAADLGRAWSYEGYFDSPDSLAVRDPRKNKLCRMTTLRDRKPAIEKLRRDGWTVVDDPTAPWDHWIRGPSKWSQLPGEGHPRLIRHLIETRKRGRRYDFQLEGVPGFLNADVSWATYDCLGNLLVGRAGHIQLYRLPDLFTGIPSFDRDLTEFGPTYA